VRYHQYGVAVLKSVSFRIIAGEKMAIVGRTGSGKTTLMSNIYISNFSELNENDGTS
jgi:ABC-type transport system involved in cytochrome bd biosynthesis fused ATPase/permease subunit